jgi:hypothetical protein
MSALARLVDAIPVVQSVADRNAKFPAPSPDQRVFNKGTMSTERWDLTTGIWVVDAVAFVSLGWINPKEAPFNAKWDGVTDDTTPNNTAFIYASNNGFSVTLPSGVTKITATLQATPHGSIFQSCHIVGAGQGYAIDVPVLANPTVRQTIIDASAITDKPAINIYCARAAYVGHLSIVGGGKKIETDYSGAAIKDMLYGASYVNGTSRDSRWSPYCGVAIDAGTGPVPGDGGYPGMAYANIPNGTLGFHLDHVGIRNFVAGIMMRPETNAIQGDTGLITNPNIINTKVAIACGGSQARGVTVNSGILWWCRSAYDGLEYGERTGNAPLFLNTQFVACFEMFSHNSGTNNLVAIGVRAEEVHRIGFQSQPTTVGWPTQFIAMDIHLLDPTGAAGAHKRCPLVWEGGNMPVLWAGGHLAEGNYEPADAFTLTGQDVVLDSVQVAMANIDRPFVGGGQDLNDPTHLRNVKIASAAGFKIYGRQVRTRLPVNRVSEHWSPQTPKRIGSAIYEYVPFQANNYINIGAVSNIVFAATTLTFDNNDPAGFVVGDLIMLPMNAIGKSIAAISMPGAKVTAINANTITCDLLYPRAYYNEAGGNIGRAIVLHHWAPGAALTGDTHTNTTFDNVAPQGVLQVGDWITAAAGIPANTRVRVVAGAVITLSRAATDTAAGKTVYWDRLNAPTLTPAF